MIRVAIALGGIAGAFARYATGSVAAASFGVVFPWGTLAINVIGSFALGLLMRLLPETTIAPATRAALTVGFCGGFTTFSTFAAEAVALGHAGSPLAATYVAASALLGPLAVIVGMEASAGIVRWRAAARDGAPSDPESAAHPARSRASRGVQDVSTLAGPGDGQPGRTPLVEPEDGA